jgi:hypothetical protein
MQRQRLGLRDLSSVPTPRSIAIDSAASAFASATPIKAYKPGPSASQGGSQTRR